MRAQHSNKQNARTQAALALAAPQLEMCTALPRLTSSRALLVAGSEHDQQHAPTRASCMIQLHIRASARFPFMDNDALRARFTFSHIVWHHAASQPFMSVAFSTLSLLLYTFNPRHEPNDVYSAGCTFTFPFVFKQE
uniref:Uncharacterized protein n=1 Tax=Ascaris lumbricoides TaxID=6252 RepID=A0A0M3I058_ASCLU